MVTTAFGPYPCCFRSVATAPYTGATCPFVLTYSKPSLSPHVASCSMNGMTPSTRESLVHTSVYAATVQVALSSSVHGGNPGCDVAHPVSVISTGISLPILASSRV